MTPPTAARRGQGLYLVAVPEAPAVPERSAGAVPAPGPQQERRATAAPPPWQRWLGPIVSLLFLAALGWWISRQQAPRLPSRPGELAAVALAVALYALNTAVRAERWHRLLQRSGLRPARADSYRLTVVGFMGNNLLPARAGDGLRVLLLNTPGSSARRTTLGTLLSERMLDVGVLLALFALLVAGVVSHPPLPPAPALGPAIAVGAAAAAAALAVGVGWAWRSGRLGRGAAWLRPVLGSALTVRGRFAVAMILVTAAIWALEAAVCAATAIGAGVDMSLLDALYLIALAAVFQLVPSGPAYAGTQDAAIILAVTSIGASNPDAVSFLILLRFVLVVPITLAGLLILATRYGGVRRVLAFARGLR